MDLLVDHRWIGPHGIGRFAREIIARLPDARRLKSSRGPLHPLNPFEIAAILKRDKPDVYFTPGFNPPRSSPVPFVFCVHDLIHLKCREESSWFKRLYYDRIVKPAGFRAAGVLTVSEYSRMEILNWSGWPAERVQVVGNGIGAAFTPIGPAFEPGFPYILHVGNHKPHKNIDRLMQALARCPIDLGIKLMFVSRPDVREHQRLMALGLGRRIVYAGDVEDEFLAQLYRGALATVLPSLYEGFGLPALEAMACASPVVCSSTTSLPEVAGTAAIFVDPADVESISTGLKRAIDDVPLRRTLREAGPAQARQFSWDTTASRVFQTLRQAAQHKP